MSKGAYAKGTLPGAKELFRGDEMSQVGKYQKKPVVVEAIQFKGNFDEIEKFVGGDAEFRSGELVVATLEGPLRASRGDWIIKGVKGEFYPCKPDIFAMTYESVEALSSSPDTGDTNKNWRNEK